MREAVRQILRIVPLLFVVSVAAFALVSLGLRPLPSPSHSNRELPLFVNPKPEDVRTLALSLMKEVAHGQSKGVAERALAELGGAGLPFILPNLDTLGPQQRERVARALMPVARRMGLWDGAAPSAGDSLPGFWQRYWQDRSIDFRPMVVRRLVERLRERESPLSRRDLVELDTYCLPELLVRSGGVNTKADIARVTRLSEILSHVTNKSWVIPPRADLTTARAIMQQWQEWWSRERWRYVALDGPLRVVALVAETEYGKWLAGMVRNGFGTTVTGRSIVGEILDRGPITLALVVPALLLAYGLGPAIARRMWRLPASARVALTLALLLPVFFPVVAFFARNRQPSGSFLGALSVMLIWVAAPIVSQALMTRTPAKKLFGLELPAVLSLALVIESIFGLEGLGRMLVQALRSGDRNLLVAFALLGTLATTGFQILSDLGGDNKGRGSRLLVVRDSSPDVES